MAMLESGIFFVNALPSISARAIGDIGRAEISCVEFYLRLPKIYMGVFPITSRVIGVNHPHIDVGEGSQPWTDISNNNDDSTRNNIIEIR